MSKFRKAPEAAALVILVSVIISIIFLILAYADRHEISEYIETASDTESTSDTDTSCRRYEFKTIRNLSAQSVSPANEASAVGKSTNPVTESGSTGAYVAYYGNIPLTQNDMNMMCTIVSSETGYCDDMAQKAVAHTILNRFNDSRFPNTMYEITTQENQYTAIHSYFDGQYREGLYPGSELWNHSMQLCYEALDEWDFTGGAFAYYSPQMIGYNAWFESLQFTYQNRYARFFTF